MIELILMLRSEFYFKVAATLERALATDQARVGLTMRERTAILDVLDHPPPGLEQLRVVLLADHTWRAREGLVPGST